MQGAERSLKNAKEAKSRELKGLNRLMHVTKLEYTVVLLHAWVRRTQQHRHQTLADDIQLKYERLWSNSECLKAALESQKSISRRALVRESNMCLERQRESTGRLLRRWGMRATDASWKNRLRSTEALHQRRLLPVQKQLADEQQQFGRLKHDSGDKISQLEGSLKVLLDDPMNTCIVCRLTYCKC